MTNDVPDEFVAKVRDICSELPEAYEEPAWVGTRWRIGSKTFAHVLTIDAGWPPAYARAAGTDGLTHVLMVRSTGPELDALRHAGHPFFTTPWRHDEIGVHLDTDTDWSEIAELVTESYCTRAPSRLGKQVHRSTAPGDHT